MRNRKLSRRGLLMTSTALATGAMVMHPFDAFAQPTAVQGAAKKDPETPTFAERES